jgi:hypothetical protein
MVLKRRQFHDWIGDYKLLKNEPAAWNQIIWRGLRIRSQWLWKVSSAMLCSVSGKSLQTFRRNALPPIRRMDWPNKSMISGYTASYPRRYSSHSLSRNLEISQKKTYTSLYCQWHLSISRCPFLHGMFEITLPPVVEGQTDGRPDGRWTRRETSIAWWP